MNTSVFKISALSLCLAMPAFAGPEAGDRTFTLSGSGASDKNFDGNTFGVNGEIGMFATDRFQWGLRQTVNASLIDDGKDSWSGVTRVFADQHFGSGNFLPFVGANIGGVYGENIDETGSAALELGFKTYVLDKTYITAQAEYAFFFKSTDDIDSNYDDGAVFYSLGVGYNF